MKLTFNNIRSLLFMVLTVAFAVVLAGRFLEFIIEPIFIDIALGITALVILFIAYFDHMESRRTTSLRIEQIIREKYLREMLNSLEEGVITTDSQGIVQSMNPSAERITLWRMTETIGYPLEKIYNVVNEETGRPFQNIVCRILKEGKTIEFENNTVLRRKNAQEIIISNSGSPICDAEGNIIGSVLVFRDITAQKKLYEEKNALTKRLLLATKSAGMGIWSWDIKKDILTWDQKVSEIYHVDASFVESVYDTWVSKLHPEDKQFINEEMQKALSGEKEYDTEFRIVWDDSSVHYIKATGIVERDEEGNPVRMIGANWDITERKKAEVALRRSESFNKGVLNSLSSHIAVVDSQGIIQAVSESWKQFAVKNGDATMPKNTQNGSNYFEVCERAIQMGDTLALKALNGIKAVLEEKKKDFYMEYPCHSPDEKRWFCMRVTKFDSSESMAVVEHKNITDVKLAESEREKITYDLIQRNKNMEQFSYIVSHNLRAPVANIIGFAELLELKKPKSATLAELVDRMSSAAHKLDEVIKDLNEILQVKTQVFENKEPVYFNTIVKGISLSIDKVIKNQNVTIKTDFESAGYIHSVKGYIYSIFYNLIYNSIKYQNPSVAALIEIKSEHTLNGLRLIFKDNGLGIDLEKNGEKIFGLYKRFHLNTEGKGMGLFMVKMQVETLGGTISVTSKVNEGTVFIIEFEKDQL